MITIKKYAGLSGQIRNELNSYIKNEFGHIPIVHEITWATPNWTIINYAENQIAAFYNIVERQIIIDGIKYKAAGINNVITPNKFRGKGFASGTLKETESFIFGNLNCALGLLLCADALIPFYEKLHWYKVDCQVYFNQPGGQKVWQGNTMLHSKQEKLNPEEINLNGLPW